MKRVIIIFAVSFGAFLVSCARAPETIEKSATVTVKDQKYGDQEVPLDPRKIVSFDYGALDTLLDLGLENKVAGLPKSNLPKILESFRDEKYQDVGTLAEPNYELLYTIKPDLIIVSGHTAAKIEELRKIAPTVYFEPKNEDFYNTFKANTEMLGRVVGREDDVRNRLAEIDQKIAALNEKTKTSDKTGLVAVYTSGRISVYGANSRFGIIHQTFGVKLADPTISETEFYGQIVNFEYLKKIDPDYLFVIDRAKILGEETLAGDFFDNDVVKSTKAAQNDKIVFLTAENWHIIGDGIRSMTKIIEEISETVN